MTKRLGWAMAVMVSLIVFQPGGSCAQDKLDLGSLAADAGGGPKIEGEEEGAIPGDNKLFTVRTDSPITALEVGDIYKNEDSTYKVTAITSKSDKGGKFTAQRITGKTDPAKKWRRLSGTGPTFIISRVTLLDLYIQGGPFLHPIAVLFVLMIILAINSIILYRRKRQCPATFVTTAESALQTGNLKQFEDLSLANKGLMAFICRAMIDRFEYSTLEDIKTRVEVAAGRQINLLRIPVKALNLVAVAAPLLGLLGTIVGMVIVFEAVAGETGAAKASALASGIRVKLFSTATALCVAIPALFLFFIFNQVLNAIISECEMITERFMHLISLHKKNAEAKAGDASRQSGR